MIRDYVTSVMRMRIRYLRNRLNQLMYLYLWSKNCLRNNRFNYWNRKILITDINTRWHSSGIDIIIFPCFYLYPLFLPACFLFLFNVIPYINFFCIFFYKFGCYIWVIKYVWEKSRLVFENIIYNNHISQISLWNCANIILIMQLAHNQFYNVFV